MGRYPDKKCIVILDNASYHHSNRDEIVALCAWHGVIVEYLPAYSPWLNPVEEVFSVSKMLCHMAK
eukprot:3689525-Rhodomonas_salina.1